MQLRDALHRDLNRAHIQLIGKDAELYDEFDRHWQEYLLHENLAAPAGLLILCIVLATAPHGLTLAVAIVAAVVVWAALTTSASLCNTAAWSVALEAVIFDRLPAPVLTKFAKQTFGLVEEAS